LDEQLRENPDAVAQHIVKLAAAGQRRPNQADVAAKLIVSVTTLGASSRRYEIPWPLLSLLRSNVDPQQIAPILAVIDAGFCCSQVEFHCIS
jgi:hypothetical protein